MDQKYLIRLLNSMGYSTRYIAAEAECNRETVMNFLKKPVQIATPFKARRKTAIDAYVPVIENLLNLDAGVKNRKNRLTAKRIHERIIKGELDETLPPQEVSLRTVERVVREIRASIANVNHKSFLKLVHDAGNAQIDFGEVALIKEGFEGRFFILVISFPQSNFRLAQVVPAQNFECLAYALVKMFELIGRVPHTIRCDNMSTAVAKVCGKGSSGVEECNHDPKDHPRVITENFKTLMVAYGFNAQFCNTAAGYEKGSVENAVGWIRRNFFDSHREFNGDIDLLNKCLVDFCFEEAQKKHYKSDKRICDLFQQDYAAMLELPREPLEICSWTDAVVSNTCRVTVDTNEYQINVPARTKIHVKKTWNKLYFYDIYGNLIAEHERCYDNRKDIIDWVFEVKLLVDRPSAFNSSHLKRLMPAPASTYLLELRAEQRKKILNVLYQRLKKGKTIASEIENLTAAIEVYGLKSVDDMINGYRGAQDVMADSTPRLTGLPGIMGETTLHQESLEDMFRGTGWEG